MEDEECSEISSLNSDPVSGDQVSNKPEWTQENDTREAGSVTSEKQSVVVYDGCLLLPR